MLFTFFPIKCHFDILFVQGEPEEKNKKNVFLQKEEPGF